MHFKMHNNSFCVWFLLWLMQMLWFIFKAVIKSLFYYLVTKILNLDLFFFSSQYHLATTMSFCQETRTVHQKYQSRYRIKHSCMCFCKSIWQVKKRIMRRFIIYTSKSIHSCFTDDFTDAIYKRHTPESLL